MKFKLKPEINIEGIKSDTVEVTHINNGKAFILLDSHYMKAKEKRKSNISTDKSCLSTTHKCISTDCLILNTVRW